MKYLYFWYGPVMLSNTEGGNDRRMPGWMCHSIGGSEFIRQQDAVKT